MATLTCNTNALQPTQFQVTIDKANYPNLQFFAQQISHPGMGLPNTDTPIPRLQSMGFAGDALTFGELSMIILLDEDMQSYQEMYNWMTRIVQTNYVSAQGSSNDKDIPDHSDITVSILTSKNNANLRIRYKDCIPTSVGDIQFESTQDASNYLNFPVSFKFNYFVFD